MVEKIKTFTDLVAWQKSHELSLKIYKATTSFPSEEKFGLTNQLRRASVSVTSNIAEGFGRNNVQEKTQSYAMAYGSLLELQNQLMLSRDIGYLKQADFIELADLTMESAKLINGLRSANKKKGQDSS